MGLCKLCGQERKFVRSHIVPLAFHKHLQSDHDRPPVIIGNNLSAYPKRSPGGLYDEEMLCDDCEQRFGPWDTAGAEHLLQRFESDKQPMTASTGEVMAYQMNGWDETSLRMFAISVLWRAAATTNYIFQRIKLGPHEQRVKQRVLEGDPGSPNDLSVVLCKWQANNPGLELAQMSPYCNKIEGINVAKLFMGGFEVYVKVDQRLLPQPFSEIMLHPGRPVYAIGRPFESSKDWAAMRPGLDRYLATRR
jgi:hypothetical protein